VSLCPLWSAELVVVERFVVWFQAVSFLVPGVKVDAVTSELVIGHVPQGMHKVYDVYERLEERRKALEKWGRHVLSQPLVAG